MNSGEVTDQDISSVEQSFARCCANGEFSDVFYDRLAHQSDEIAPLFVETDMIAQNELLREGIQNLIAMARGCHEAKTRVGEIAQTHSRNLHDIRPELYPFWVQALIEAIRECDPECSPDLEASWRLTVEPGIAMIISRY